MPLYERCVHRPVFTVVLSAGVLVVGLLGLARLGVREYPAVDPPVISILANYSGASAEVVESQITVPLEEAVNTVAGIKTLTSVSRDGAARIRAEFELGTDLETAASDIRDQITRAVRLLPREVDPPSISKADADSSPVLTLLVRSEQHDLIALTDLADRIKDRLQTIPRVGSVDVLGEKRESIKLWLDPDRMAAYGVTAPDVRAAVQRANVQLPGGRIENDASELTVQVESRLSRPEDFAQLVIAANGGRVVRFEEIGRAEFAPLNERISFKVGGEPAVGLAVRPQPGANQVAIADAAKARLAEVQATLPPGVRVEVASDATTFVRRAIVELRETIVVALGLVVVVLFLFLRSWRLTLVPAVVIPISLIGTFAVLEAAGFSLNVLTLLGLVLAVGLVVDDAIVVVENIHRRRQQGLPALTAGVEGTREVFTAVIATTLALVAVFSPVMFLSGLSGRLFREFGLTIAAAVILSSFLALTLTPMLSARLQGGEVRWLAWFDRLLAAGQRGYGRALRPVLGKPWWALAVLAAAAGGIVALHRSLPSELAPLEDRDQLTLRMTGPEGTSYPAMARAVDAWAEIVRESVPEARLVTSQVPASGARSGTGVANTGLVEVMLPPKNTRAASQGEIAARLERLARRFPEARVSIVQEPSVGDRRAGNAVQFVVGAPDLDTLRTAVPAMLSSLDGEPAFSDVDVDLRFTRPELRVSFDRDRLQDFGVSATAVAETLQAALSTQRVGTYTRGGRQYEIVQQVAETARQDAGVLDRLAVRGAADRWVALDNLVAVDEAVTAPQRFRYARQLAATLTGRLAPSGTMADGIATMRTAARNAALPAGTNGALAGAAAEFEESRRGLLTGFGLALLFLYLVLAAQFESWRAPTVILLTVPLALLGALLTLKVFGQTLNLFSQIGIIMLVGLITKNGILLVEFTLQRIAAGAAAEVAVREAADTRLRPILMTTVSTVLGILPIALAWGAGAESRVSLGVAVVGGLVVGTAFTLFVVPPMFLLVMGRTPRRVSEPVVVVSGVQTGEQVGRA